MNRHEAILDAALGLFGEQRTMDAITIRAICSRSNTSNGSLYHFFEDRNAILLSLYMRVFKEGVFPAILGAARGSTGAEDGIRASVDAYMKWIREHPNEARFLYAASGSPELVSATNEIVAMKTEFLLAFAEWLEPYALAGQVRRLPVWALDPVLFGAVHEVCRRWLAGAPIPFSEAATLLKDIVWRSIAPETNGTPKPSTRRVSKA